MLFVTLSYCLHVRLLASRMRACCRGGRGPRHWVSKFGLTRPAPYALQFIALGYFFTIPVRLLAARLIDAVCGAAFDARRIASPLASHWPAGLQVLLVSRVCACSCSVSSRDCAVAAVAGGARGTGCRGMGLPVGLLRAPKGRNAWGFTYPSPFRSTFP